MKKIGKIMIVVGLSVAIISLSVAAFNVNPFFGCCVFGLGVLFSGVFISTDGLI